MKIAVRRGHQRTGRDGCASALVNEIDVANAYSQALIKNLQSLGHQVLDVTPPEANRSLTDSLWYGINKANKWGADLFISCHANNAYNSYNGAIGCEVIYHRNSTKGKEYAIKVERELSNLGFKSRGAKTDVRGLAEINNTKCSCIIIEPFFVEATEDVALYKKVGGQGIANAITKGITGKIISSTNTQQSTLSNNTYSKDFIASVQRDLRHCRFFEGEANGLMDEKTKYAIYKFRQVVGLPEASYLDQSVVNALNDIVKRPEIGYNNHHVYATRFIQWWIGANKDGIYGNNTVLKVKEWQKKNKLNPDGIIGNNSWNKILK